MKDIKIQKLDKLIKDILNLMMISKNDNNNDESIIIAFDARNLNKSNSNANFYSKRSQSDK